LRIVFALALLTGAALLLRHQLRDYTLTEVGRSLRALPLWRVAASAVLTVLGYLALIGHDVIGLQHLRLKVALHRIALAAFVAYAFSNSAPVSFVVAGALRFRYYSKWGMNAADTKRLVGLTLSTYVLGLLTATAFALSVGRFTMPAFLHLPFRDSLPIGIASGIILVAYVIWTGARGKALGAKHHEALGPTMGFAASQIGVSLASWILAGAALYILVTPDRPLSFGAFILGRLVALIAQVPGGLGVFDAVMIWGLRAVVPPPITLAALFGYRVIYYLLPLLLAVTLMFVREGHSLLRRRGKGSRDR
jgi:uncharacterized membrane protein YbhN (UPF0104 family)